MTNVATYDLTDAAMCLWEVLLDMGEAAQPEAMRAFWASAGTCAMRDQVQKLAPFCHLEWQAAFNADEFDGCFDWDWCPQWLETRVAWSEHGASLREDDGEQTGETDQLGEALSILREIAAMDRDDDGDIILGADENRRNALHDRICALVR